MQPDSGRTKKLLMHKHEIRRLIDKTEQKGFQLVPLNLNGKAGKVQCKMDLAKGQGKGEHDKREAEWAMKSRSR